MRILHKLTATEQKCLIKCDLFVWKHNCGNLKWFFLASKFWAIISFNALEKFCEQSGTIIRTSLKIFPTSFRIGREKFWRILLSLKKSFSEFMNSGLETDYLWKLNFCPAKTFRVSKFCRVTLALLLYTNLNGNVEQKRDHLEISVRKMRLTFTKILIIKPDLSVKGPPNFKCSNVLLQHERKLSSLFVKWWGKFWNARVFST